MKNLFNYIIITAGFVLTSGCTEELEFESGGILAVSIFDANTGAPIPNANVIAYRTIDDWAFDERRVDIFTTDQKGQFIMAGAKTGEYYFDIVAGMKCNWANPSAHYVEEGSIYQSSEYINENINIVVSSTEGREWRITRVFDEDGVDIPEYSCMTDNTVIFTKAGAYEMQDMSNDCDTIADFFEASWWGVGEHYLGLVYDNGASVKDLYITDLSDQSFIATEYRADETINYRYERVD
ncbi:hypothetical protein AAOE16_15970 [Ekhidna sp. MALMAid0563]|uniref:hypothetical protein n=1 Tax=Ekhidna sp. MALMAid0563 TaxID=3143937 RepID=UPI0032DE5EAB